MAPQPPRPEPHIILTIRSTAGTWEGARFNRSNKAGKILESGIEHFRLDPNPPRPYVLRRESTDEALPLDQKIETIGLHDGETVLIQATQATDG